MINRRVFTLGLLGVLSGWAGVAWATPACEQLYSVGAAAFDGEDSVSYLSPDGGQLAWFRARPGAEPVLQARLPVSASWLSVGYPVRGPSLWADATSTVAYLTSQGHLLELSATGARRVPDCDTDLDATNQALDFALEHGEGRWSMAVLCALADPPSGVNVQQLRLYVREEGGELIERGRRRVDPLYWYGAGEDEFQIREGAAGTYTILAGRSLFYFEGDSFTGEESLASLVEPDSRLRIATDASGMTLFALSSQALGSGNYVSTLSRVERLATGTLSATTAALPAEVREPRDLWPLDRSTLLVRGEAVYRLRADGEGWRIDGAKNLYGTIVDARGSEPLIALIDYGEDDVTLSLADLRGTRTRVANIGSHEGQTGCCSLVGSSRSSAGSLGWFLALSLGLALHRARHRARKLIPLVATCLVLFSVQNARADGRREELEARLTSRRAEQLRQAAGATLGAAGGLLAFAVISSSVGVGQIFESDGDAAGWFHGAIGLAVVGGPTLVSGIALAIAARVEGKRADRVEQQMEERRRQRRYERLQELQQQIQLEGISVAPLLRGRAADGALASVSLRF